MLYSRVGVKDINFKISQKMTSNLQMKTKFERITARERVTRSRVTLANMIDYFFSTL